METWGGTRCPGCGLEVESRYLADTNLSHFGTMYGGGSYHITAFGFACDKGGTFKCPGENLEWQNEA